MLKHCFLGANTPEGFRSEYRTLQTDPRIRRLRILKGGPGCGKSTLMRKVAEAGERLGLRALRVACSSDPDSLDAVVLPEIGLAVADGTAPHVLEPEVCGCDANYVNLGACYRRTPQPADAAAIAAEKAANRSCYGPAYACLAGCGAVQRAIACLTAPVEAAATKEALRQLEEERLPQGDEDGSALRCYLSGVTPKGLMQWETGCGTVWAIRDSFRLGAPLLRRLAAAYRKAGYRTVLAMDPFAPDQPSGLLIPTLDRAYLREDPILRTEQRAMKVLNLDAAAEAGLPAAQRERIEALNALRQQLAEEAVGWLARAKAHHDALEQLCRPLVDFGAVDEETQRMIDTLLTEA